MAENKHSEGWVSFAVVMASIAGVVNMMFGASALFAKEAFVEESLVFLGLQQWGWILVIFGLLQLVAAFGLIGRKNWGRIFAIVIAAVSIVAWMLWIGTFPIAGITALVLDILIIFGLSVTREYFE